MDIRRIYEYALQREHEGKRFFLENAGRLQNAAAAHAFMILAAEEQKHIEFIQAEIQKLEQGSPEDTPAPVDENPDVFARRAESEQVSQRVDESMVADLPVLRLAYLIERDFAEFYEQAASKTGGNARKALETLAYWERRHEALFKGMHDAAFEQYTQMPWGG